MITINDCNRYVAFIQVTLCITETEPARVVLEVTLDAGPEFIEPYYIRCFFERKRIAVMSLFNGHDQFVVFMCDRLEPHPMGYVAE